MSTVRVRKHEVDKQLHYFSHTKMKDITKKTYQDALISLKNKEYGNTTLEGIHSTGRMIFKKAVELDVIKNDPTQYAIVPTIQKTIEEIEQE